PPPGLPDSGVTGSGPPAPAPVGPAPPARRYWPPPAAATPCPDAPDRPCNCRADAGGPGADRDPPSPEPALRWPAAGGHCADPAPGGPTARRNWRGHRCPGL